MVCATSRLRPACAYTQSDQSLCWSLEYYTSIKLLTEHLLEFLSLKGCCTDSSQSAHVKMPHCWKAHVTAKIFFQGGTECRQRRSMLMRQSYFLEKLVTMVKLVTCESGNRKKKVSLTGICWTHFQK